MTNTQATETQLNNLIAEIDNEIVILEQKAVKAMMRSMDFNIGYVESQRHGMTATRHTLQASRLRSIVRKYDVPSLTVQMQADLLTLADAERSGFMGSVSFGLTSAGARRMLKDPAADREYFAWALHQEALAAAEFVARLEA